uniref:uncharacterized protein LOC132692269 n=1 Tax=Panthera onca TaxID=9690 RepID=UPI0029546CF0|nr:uncharacterized protein LOC132692269 [Panthera onca]
MGRAGGETEEAGPPMSVPPAVPRRPRRRRGGRRCCCCRRRCFPTPSAAAGPAAAGDVPPLRSPAFASASPRRSFTHTGTAAELGRHSPGRTLPSSSSAAAAAAAATAPASASSPSSSRPPPPAPRQPPPPCGASPPLPAPTSKLRAPIGWRARQFLLGRALVVRPSSRSSSPSPPPLCFLPAASPVGLPPPPPSHRSGVTVAGRPRLGKENGQGVAAGRSGALPCHPQPGVASALDPAHSPAQLWQLCLVGWVKPQLYSLRTMCPGEIPFPGLHLCASKWVHVTSSGQGIVD